MGREQGNEAADHRRDGRVHQRHQQAGEEQRGEQPPRLADEVPVEAEQRVRRRRFRHRRAEEARGGAAGRGDGIEEVFEEAEKHGAAAHMAAGRAPFNVRFRARQPFRRTRDLRRGASRPPPSRATVRRSPAQKPGAREDIHGREQPVRAGGRRCRAPENGAGPRRRCGTLALSSARAQRGGAWPDGLRALHRPLPAGRRHRHPVAHLVRQDGGDHRPAIHRGEPQRLRRQCRHRGHRPRGAGRRPPSASPPWRRWPSRPRSTATCPSTWRGTSPTSAASGTCRTCSSSTTTCRRAPCRS